jgi:cytochrome c oxidase subunit 4
MAHQTAHAATEAHGLRPRQYIFIGVFLTVVTLIELQVSFTPSLSGAITPILLFLSAVKFTFVVAYFMHLRFESGLLGRVFVGSLLLAIAVLFALMGLFWGDHNKSTQAERALEGQTTASAPAH